MNFIKLEVLYKEVLEYIVGGVNSFFCFFKVVGGGVFVVMECGKGVYFWDVDGNKYIDYLVVYGFIIIGYVYLYIIKVIIIVVENGVFYGILIVLEVKFVKMLKEVMFVLDKVCFVNFGIEVVMIMICVVCVYIGCIKIMKFVGCYYGYFDLVFVVVGFGFFILGIFDLVGVL